MKVWSSELSCSIMLYYNFHLNLSMFVCVFVLTSYRSLVESTHVYAFYSFLSEFNFQFQTLVGWMYLLSNRAPDQRTGVGHTDGAGLRLNEAQLRRLRSEGPVALTRGATSRGSRVETEPLAVCGRGARQAACSASTHGVCVCSVTAWVAPSSVDAHTAGGHR